MPEKHDPKSPFRRALVIGNPIAGRGRGEASARALSEGLQRLGVDVELHLTRARGDGVGRVASRRNDVDLVVSVGGDGTLREVLEGLDGERTPVAVFPLGTANVLSLDLKLPRDVEGTLRVIAGRKTQLLDVARVNGHLSFLVSGVGLDASAVREVERARRGPISKFSYVPAMLRALRGYRPPHLELEIDGVRVDGPVGMLLISNIIHYGGVIRLSADRALDDGLWEVYVFRNAGLPALAAAGLRGFFSHLPGGSCEMLRARRVRITASEPVAYHVDGDFRGETPLDFEVSPVRRTLLVP
jgi:YegS/Rv2252/BmrU family lipid kinase